MLQISVLLVLLYASTATSAIVKESAIFTKINTISTSRSRWLATFVIDLDPIDQILETIEDRIEVTRQTVLNLEHNPTSTLRSVFNSFRNIEKDLLSLDNTVQQLKTRFNEHKMHRPREKRSVLPFVGDALSFLFGTVSHGDLNRIKENLNKLTRNALKLEHVVKDSLTLINVSRTAIIENRHTINVLVGRIGYINNALRNITRDHGARLDALETVLPVKFRLEAVIRELNHAIDKTIMYLEHMELQVNVLSAGKLAPSVVTPKRLQAILESIQLSLRTTVKLPVDPRKNIWLYYRFLTCSTFFDANKIIVVVPIPLLDINNEFEVYKVHNLPIPGNNSVMSRTAAQYKLEGAGFAINMDRTKYHILSEVGLQECSNPFKGFCQFTSPIYPILGHSHCITSLFIRNDRMIEVNCKAYVLTGITLPQALYLGTGAWAISTNKPLMFAITCPTDTMQHTSKSVLPSIGILRLPPACSATSQELMLTPYYHSETIYNVPQSEVLSLLSSNFSLSNIWEVFHKKTKIPEFPKLPEKLKELGSIPMSKLIDEMNSFEVVDPEESKVVNWWYIVGASLVVLIVVIVIVYRVRNGCNGTLFGLWRVRAEKGVTEPEALELVSTLAVTQDESMGRRMVDPSAPTVDNVDAESRTVDFNDVPPTPSQRKPFMGMTLLAPRA